MTSRGRNTRGAVKPTNSPNSRSALRKTLGMMPALDDDREPARDELFGTLAAPALVGG